MLFFYCFVRLDMIVAIQIIEKFCARSCKWNDCFSCTFDSALVKSWWQGSPTFSAFSYYWVHFSFKMQLNERSCRYKWKMTITRMPKVVMMSAFHLVLVKSQSNNFKLWWSQLSPHSSTLHFLRPALTPEAKADGRSSLSTFFNTSVFFFFYFGSYKQKNA